MMGLCWERQIGGRRGDSPAIQCNRTGQPNGSPRLVLPWTRGPSQSSSRDSWQANTKPARALVLGSLGSDMKVSGDAEAQSTRQAVSSTPGHQDGEVGLGKRREEGWTWWAVIGCGVVQGRCRRRAICCPTPLQGRRGKAHPAASFHLVCQASSSRLPRRRKKQQTPSASLTNQRRSYTPTG